MTDSKWLILKAGMFIWMALVLAGAFFYAPLDPVLKDYTRALYFHVPSAWIAVLAFLIGAFYSIRYLSRQDIHLDHYAEAASQLGFLFTILATVTGAVWAKATWGVYWNWDPRQTSIFILLLIYAAYFALRSAIDQPDRKASLSAVYSILAFITVPFLVFILPRLGFSLHPSETIVDNQGSVGMGSRQLLVFLSSLGAHTALFGWLYKLKRDVIDLKIEIKKLEQ